MRLTWKAAAILLSSASSSAYVSPDAGALVRVSEQASGSPAAPTLHGSAASAQIDISCPDCSESGSESNDDKIINLEFKALASDKPCGLSNLLINGQVLKQEWNGVEAWGDGVITTQNVNGLGIRKLYASWKTSCIFDVVPDGGSNSQGQDVAQVLIFTLNQVDGKDIDGRSGFTVSFKQTTPEILRISPVPVTSAGEDESAEEWRDPPSALKWSSPGQGNKESSTLASIENEITQLKQLKAEAKELRRLIEEKKKTIKALIEQDYQSFKAEIRHCDGIRCVIKAMLHKARGAIRMVCHRFRPSKDDHQHHQHLPTPQDGSDAATPPANDDPVSLPSHHNFRPHFLPHELEDDHPKSPLRKTLKALKICVIALGLVSFFGLIFRKCRNPRRRAECAARREERRNIRLFRRAACRQRWRNWFCRRKPVRSEYNEKQALIIDQESILESAMQAEIHELRKAHEMVNDMVMAEEGRYIHELDGGLTRRSSLPGYDSRSESGATEPPSYEEQLAGDSVADGFQYTPEGTASTPASSVIDTSPRVSLDSRETRDFV